MKTLLLWIFALAALASLSFGQSASQPVNKKDAWINQHQSPSGFPVGWNIVSDGGTTLAASGAFVDATVFPITGADVCTQINNALLALPAGGGTVDARGITGGTTQTATCNSNPFAGVSATATLLLGAVTFQTTATWVIPSRSRVFGIGGGASGTGTAAGANTVLQWTGTGSSGIVMSLGTSTGTPFGVYVGDLAIDCNVTSATGSTVTGLQNLYAQEQSGANDITFKDCSGSSLDVEGNGSQNSGPYTNLNIMHPHDSCKSTTLPVVYSGAAKRGINGLTVVADSCTTNKPLAGVDINGSGNKFNGDVFERIHCENLVNCILIGDKAETTAIILSGVTGCPHNANNYSCSNVVQISNAFAGTGDIVIEGLALNNGGGNLVLDQVGGNTITDTSLGFYALGLGTPPSVISTSTTAPIQFTTPVQFTNHLGTSTHDTAGTCTLSAGACSFSFVTSYTAAPVCTANSTGSKNAMRVTPTAGGLTITSSSSTDTSVVGYICLGNPN